MSPIDYRKYPKNWPDIRAVVLARAGETVDRRGFITREAECEWCGLTNRTWYHRLPGQIVWCCDAPNEIALCPYCGDTNHIPVKIVLTVAHLDHDPENDDVCVTRLRALCQKCHLAYDAPMRSQEPGQEEGPGTPVRYGDDALWLTRPSE